MKSTGSRTASPGSSRTVATAQMVFRPTIRENVDWIARTIARAAKRGAEIILFPECATTGYAADFSRLPRRDLQDAIEEIGALAGLHRLHVLVGSPMFRGRSLFNCLLVFSPDGRLTYQYAKCQLTESDRQWFTPGNAMALFEVAGIPATAIICHERRYPELVRLPVMAGARLIFHPNAGMDSRSVSRRKHGGRDGMVARAFENAVPYIFSNSVGPQGGGKWSAGDSKIVNSDGRTIRQADNKGEALLVARLDLSIATAKYACDMLAHPEFLSATWAALIRRVRKQARILEVPA